MLCVVDSGSTKADWLLASDKLNNEPIHTIGFNPFFHSSDFVFQTLSNSQELAPYADSIDELYFFGAGCSSTERKKIIHQGLQRYFKNAKITVDHDMLACAYSTLGNEAGICCIIGTGSNSCWYDGKDILENNYGLGYILGDEASGSYFGKKLLTHFLYGIMPKEISDDFMASYQVSKNTIIDHVYRQPNANVWLSSFAIFISKHQQHPYIQKLLKDGLREFLELYVCSYPEYKHVKVHFVGSIAFYSQDELSEVAKEMHVNVGEIIKQPVFGLLDYYLGRKK